MLILTMRTDNPEAELGLYDDEKQLTELIWQAHRQLAETLHQQIEALLSSKSKTLHDLQGIVCYQGPGSFTGLRIGISVANALAYSLQVPAVAVNGDDWQRNGIIRLKNGQSDNILVPEYGAEVHITQQKK
jgi:tRNA threonylcarbamoyladenosine biosynthesis protein TsaB